MQKKLWFKDFINFAQWNSSTVFQNVDQHGAGAIRSFVYFSPSVRRTGFFALALVQAAVYSFWLWISLLLVSCSQQLIPWQRKDLPPANLCLDSLWWSFVEVCGRVGGLLLILAFIGSRWTIPFCFLVGKILGGWGKWFLSSMNSEIVLSKNERRYKETSEFLEGDFGFPRLLTGERTYGIEYVQNMFPPSESYRSQTGN